jgi:hypothetical protein
MSYALYILILFGLKSEPLLELDHERGELGEQDLEKILR